jgi:GrpB-like predicted nucleotidyltransferase (UPF0157 family)
VRHDWTVHLAESDPAWAEWYAREEDRIRTALGPRALAVEHVGSTSVPGLAAKPVIDIVLVVADSSDEAAYVSKRELAAKRWVYVQDYADAKSSVVEAIIARALAGQQS